MPVRTRFLYVGIGFLASKAIRIEDGIMTLAFYVDKNRRILQFAGEDVRDFLQGIVTSDMNRLRANRSLFAALLTPQGKYLSDFLLIEGSSGKILLDAAASQADDAAKRMLMYRLRRDVSIAPEPSLEVACLFGEDAARTLDLPEKRGATGRWRGNLAVVDPRSTALGARVYGTGLPNHMASLGANSVTKMEWDAHRIAHMVPEGGQDLEPSGVYPLEARFAELDGVDFGKGCFVGQEVTARMRHKAALKRGILRVRLKENPPPSGTAIYADGKPAGTLLSSAKGEGLALLRHDRVQAAEQLLAGDAHIEVLRS